MKIQHSTDPYYVNAPEPVIYRIIINKTYKPDIIVTKHITMSPIRLHMYADYDHFSNPFQRSKDNLYNSLF